MLSTGLFRFGPFLLDAARRTLHRDGTPVALTPKAFDALLLLVERRDRVVAKRELLSELWPDTAVEEATLSQHVFMLRRALNGSMTGESEYITTVHRRGYRFVAPVSPQDRRETDDDVCGERRGPSRLSRGFVAVGVLVTVIGVALAIARTLDQHPVRARTVRLTMVLPPDQHLARLARGAPAISPDGSLVVYAAGGRLYARKLADPVAYPIPGTDLDAAGPFFSGDGAWIGFWSARDSTLKKTRITGGAPVTLTAASNPRGADWLGDRIVYADGAKGILSVGDSGGAPEPWFTGEPDQILSRPQVLPPGDAVLATRAAMIGNSPTASDIVVYSRQGGQRTTLVANASSARYVSPDRLVFATGSSLLAVRFDRRRLRVAGTPVVIANDVMAPGVYDVAGDDTLVYVSAPDSTSAKLRLGILQRGGTIRVLDAPAARYTAISASPDSRRIAVQTDDDDGTIWIVSAVGGSVRRLTFQGHAMSPIWSPDGRSIAFSSTRGSGGGIFVEPADGTGSPERLTTAPPGVEHQPSSWSADGQLIAYTSVQLGVKDTIWTVDTGRRHVTRQVLAVAGSNQMFPRFAPDERWLAYASEGEAGDSRLQVFVEPWPRTGVKHQVSRDGGMMPAWSRDGRRLFYVRPPGQVTAVDVRTTPSLTFGVPAPISSENAIGDTGYDVMADDRVILPVDGDPFSRARVREVDVINVVLHWWQSPVRASREPIVALRK
jgi:DNA-binding winged helix-turn-helix (wHTH) protein/dipeptidyl aminopeptidase/acylaminoacyl peptidase